MAAESPSWDNSDHLPNYQGWLNRHRLLDQDVEAHLAHAEVAEHFGNQDEAKLHLLKAARSAIKVVKRISTEGITTHQRKRLGKHAEVAVVGLISAGALGEARRAAARVILNPILPEVSRNIIMSRIEQLRKPPAQA